MDTQQKRRGVSERVAAFIRRHPLLAVLASLGLVLAIAPGAGRLRSDFTHRGYFYDSDPLLKDLDKMERRFGNDDAVVIAVHSPSGIFDEDSIALTRDLTERLWHAPEVMRVDSITNFRWAHAAGEELVVEPLVPDDRPLTAALLAERRQVAVTHESLPGYLISKDATTALVFARVRPAMDGKAPDARRITAAVDEIVHSLARTDHTFYVTGGPAIEAAYASAAQKDNSRMMPVVLAICIGILALLLRNVAAVFLCMCVAGVGSFASLCVAGWLGVEFTSVTAALPVIFIAIAITDPIRIMSAYLLDLTRGVERKEAAEIALGRNFLPTVATASTTAFGFLSYLTSDIKTVAGFGLVAGVSCLVAWSFGQLFVGGMLFLLPWRKVTKVSEPRLARYAPRMTDWIFKYRTWVCVAFAAVTVVAAGLTSTVHVDADPVQYFAADHPLRKATDFIESGVGAARSVELVIDSGEADGIKDPAFLSRVDAFEKWLRARPKITQTVSVTDVLKHVNRALHGGEDAAYKLPDDRRAVAQELLMYTLNLPEGMGINDRVTLNNDALRVTALWTIGSSNEALKEIPLIEHKAEELGLNVTVTGKYPLFQRLEYHLVRSFLSSFGTELVIVGVILTIFFRSSWLGLLAIIPNLVPLVAGGGVLWLLGEKLTVGTVLVASLCLGIAVDDTTHVFADFLRSRSLGMNPRESIEEFYRDKALALGSTSTVLVATFGAFYLSTFTPNRVFGVMTAIVLTLGLIADMTLSPAILSGFGKKRAAARAANSDPVELDGPPPVFGEAEG